MQVNVTVTLLLFHPAAFGLGETEAIILGGNANVMVALAVAEGLAWLVAVTVTV